MLGSATGETSRGYHTLIRSYVVPGMVPLSSYGALWHGALLSYYPTTVRAWHGARLVLDALDGGQGCGYEST